MILGCTLTRRATSIFQSLEEDLAGFAELHGSSYRCDVFGSAKRDAQCDDTFYVQRECNDDSACWDVAEEV